MAGDHETTTAALVGRIGEDVRTLVRDEVELVAGELGRVARIAAVEAGVVAIGGVVVLIGLAMLCAAVVVALAPVIASLALRLVLVGVGYLILGGLASAVFARRLRRDAAPQLAVPRYEARSTIAGVAESVRSRGAASHA